MNKKTAHYIIGIITVLAGFVRAEILANFDFENHTAGPTITAAGEVRSKKILGDGYPFKNNATPANCLVSPLTPSDKTRLDRMGANVRSDTLAATAPGGNFIEISPTRLAAPKDTDIEPVKSGDCFIFSVKAAEGYLLNIDSFSFDLGIARGANDRGGITLRGQGWYSLDNGKKWIRMGKARSVLNTSPKSFIGFVSTSESLTRFKDLQEQAGEVLIALSMGDNSARNSYIVGQETDPAALYVDNIRLDGSVTKAE